MCLGLENNAPTTGSTAKAIHIVRHSATHNRDVCTCVYRTACSVVRCGRCSLSLSLRVGIRFPGVSRPDCAGSSPTRHGL